MSVGLKTEFKKPFRFILFPGNEPYDILIESLFNDLGLYFADKAEFIGLVRYFFQYVPGFFEP